MNSAHINQMAASDVKIDADRGATKSVVITLPCGGRRRMYVEEYRKLVERMREALGWFDANEQRRMF